MKRLNYYYLVAGLLSILFSITHELNGQLSVLSILYLKISELDIINSLQCIWHIITAENLLFGIAFILMAFSRKIKNTIYVAWLIFGMIGIRFFVIIVTALMVKQVQYYSLVIDSVAIVIYLVIIFLGIRKTNKNTNTLNQGV